MRAVALLLRRLRRVHGPIERRELRPSATAAAAAAPSTSSPSAVSAARAVSMVAARAEELREDAARALCVVPAAGAGAAREEALRLLVPVRRVLLLLRRVVRVGRERDGAEGRLRLAAPGEIEGGVGEEAGAHDVLHRARRVERG